MTQDSELPMLSTDPRRPTHQRYSKRYIERKRKDYESEIQSGLRWLDKLEQKFAQSFTGEPEDDPGDLLFRIDLTKREIVYLRQCLAAFNESSPREKGAPRYTTWR